MNVCSIHNLLKPCSVCAEGELRDTRDELESARDAARVEETLRMEAEAERDRLAAESAGVISGRCDECAPIIPEALEPRTRLMLAAYALLPHALDCDRCETGVGCVVFERLRGEARTAREEVVTD
jgi:hypothetical protein